jgi:MFS transporter, putative metabolite transport protein
VSRIGAAVGTYLVPVSLSGLGTGPTMLIGAGLTALGFVISLFWAEETRNRNLASAAQSPTEGDKASPSRSLGQANGKAAV